MLSMNMSQCVAIVSFVAVSLTTVGAWAEQATLQVKNGPKYTGELIEYVPGDHVTVDVGAGKILRFKRAELDSLEIGAPATAGPVVKAAPTQRAQPKSDPVAAAPPAPKKPKNVATSDRASHETPAQQDTTTDLVRAAAVHALLNERADWQARDTKLAAPVLFTLVGVIATAVGVGLQFAYHDSERELSPKPLGEPPTYKKKEGYNAASIMSFGSGAALLTTGFALFLHRTSDSRRDRELQRIDSQLKSLGAPATLTPWVQASGALAGGLDLRVSL